MKSEQGEKRIFIAFTLLRIINLKKESLNIGPEKKDGEINRKCGKVYYFSKRAMINDVKIEEEIVS